MPSNVSTNGVTTNTALVIADPANDDWGDAKVAGPNHGHPIVSDSLTDDRESHVDDSLGSSAAIGADVGNEDTTGTIEEYQRHVTTEKFLAMVFGTSGNASYQGEILDSNTSCTGGTTTTLEDTGKTWDVDEFAGKYVVTGHTGDGLRQVAQITSNTSDTLTVPTWTSPGTNTPYEISNFAPLTKSILTSGAAGTATDSTQSWGDLVGKHIKITGGLGSGQSRYITANTGTEVTVRENWTTTPDNTSTYEISNQAALKTYQWSDSLIGIFGTYVKDKSAVYIEEFPSIKVTGVTLTGVFGSPVNASIETIASAREHASVVNTTGTFASVTTLETRNRVLFNNNTVIRYKDQDGTALGAGDILEHVTDVEIAPVRDMAGVHGTGSGASIDEPTQNSIPLPTFKFTLGRVESAGFFNDFKANTAKKIDIEFVGTAIALDGSETVNRSVKFEFPHALISAVPSSTDQGIDTLEVTLNLYSALTAPTGFDHTDVMRCYVINDFAGDFLQIGNV